MLKYFYLCTILLITTLFYKEIQEQMNHGTFIQTAQAQLQMKPFYPTASPTPAGGIPPTNTPTPIHATNTPTPLPGAATNTPTPVQGIDPLQCLVDNVSEQKLREYMGNLVDNDTTASRDEAQTRFSNSQGNATEATYIKSHFAEHGLENEFQPFSGGGVNSKNIIGRRRGTILPNEYYLVTSHMDTMPSSMSGGAPGADDNGSGTILVMEVARVFKACNFQTKRTIEFITFSGEEEGLIGSNYYVRNYLQNETSSKTIKGVINADMIGTRRGSSHIKATYNPARPGLTLAQKIIQTKNRYNLPLTITLESNTENRSDHAYFHRNNIPAAFIYEAEFSGVYHRSADKPSHPEFSFQQITEATKAVAATIAELANE